MQSIDHDLFMMPLSAAPPQSPPHLHTSKYAFYIRTMLCFTMIALGLLSWFIDIQALLANIFPPAFAQAFEPWLALTTHRLLVITFVAASVLLLYRNLRHYYSSPQFWGITCPNCYNDSLMRIHRTRAQRLSGSLVSLPVRHFQCKRCRWRGSRIDRNIFQ